MSFKELLTKEYEDRSVELEKQIDDYNLLLEKKKSESDNIDNEINTKSSEIENKKIAINKFENDIIELKNELTDLSNPSEPLYIVAFPDNSVSIVKEYDLQEVSNIELKEFNKLIDGIERNKAVTKLTKDEYKELLKTTDFKNRPLDKEYYKDQRNGKAFAQFHIRNILDNDKKLFDEKKLSFQEMIIGHSLHSDIRWDLEGVKGLIQGVIVESDIESYLRVFKGEINPEQKGVPNVQKGLFLDKPKTPEPKTMSKKESDELLLDKKGAKIVDDYIMHDKSFFLAPGTIGSKHGWGYLGTIWEGKISTATERDDYHELFFNSDESMPEKNQKLLNGKFIIKAFSDKAGKRYLFWKSTKEPYPVNPYIHFDKGMHKILPIKSVTKFSKEDYPDFKQRKEEWEKRNEYEKTL